MTDHLPHVHGKSRTLSGFPVFGTDHSVSGTFRTTGRVTPRNRSIIFEACYWRRPDTRCCCQLSAHKAAAAVPLPILCRNSLPWQLPSHCPQRPPPYHCRFPTPLAPCTAFNGRPCCTPQHVGRGPLRPRPTPDRCAPPSPTFSCPPHLPVARLRRALASPYTSVAGGAAQTPRPRGPGAAAQRQTPRLPVFDSLGLKCGLLVEAYSNRCSGGDRVEEKCCGVFTGVITDVNFALSFWRKLNLGFYFCLVSNFPTKTLTLNNLSRIK